MAQSDILEADRTQANGTIADFLHAIHSRDYLAAKASDFHGFTRGALLVSAVFVLTTVLWDYAIDPVGAGQAVWLRVVESMAALVWALASWRHADAPLARLAAIGVPLVVEAIFIQILSILDQGPSYGVGGFLYFFIFLPFLLLAQPLSLAALIFVLVAIFPRVMEPLGLSAGLDWNIYGAYIGLALLPIIVILLLFEYLYWTVFCYRRQIEMQAATDALTDVANRRYFLREGGRSLEQHHRDQCAAGLMFIDIDRFKRINDAHGHRIGDAALNHVVQVLRTHLRAGDLMARYGGEEFAVLLPRTRAESAGQIAERMREAVRDTPFEGAGDESQISLTVSIGVTMYDPAVDGAPDLGGLLHVADIGVYAAKTRGRNQVVIRACPESPNTAPAKASQA